MNDEHILFEAEIGVETTRTDTEIQWSVDSQNKAIASHLEAMAILKKSARKLVDPNNQRDIAFEIRSAVGMRSDSFRLSLILIGGSTDDFLIEDLAKQASHAITDALISAADAITKLNASSYPERIKFTSDSYDNSEECTDIAVTSEQAYEIAEAIRNSRNLFSDLLFSTNDSQPIKIPMVKESAINIRSDAEEIRVKACIHELSRNLTAKVYPEGEKFNRNALIRIYICDHHWEAIGTALTKQQSVNLTLRPNFRLHHGKKQLKSYDLIRIHSDGDTIDTTPLFQ